MTVRNEQAPVPFGDDVARCAQCGTRDSHAVDSEYGLLCIRCAFRQNEHDERRTVFAHLTPGSLGFLSEEE